MLLCELDFSEILFSGHQSEFRLCKTPQGSTYALKFFKDHNDLLTEFQALNELADHPGIVRLYDKTDKCLVLEYLENDFFEFI
jgi:hypothetical protein